MEDNILMHVVEEPVRKGVLLDLVLTNKEGPVGDVKAGGSLGCSDHQIVEFRNMEKKIRWTVILDFRKAHFDFFSDLLGGIPWIRTLEGKRALESSLTFKHPFPKLKTGTSLRVRNQSKVVGVAHA